DPALMMQELSRGRPGCAAAKADRCTFEYAVGSRDIAGRAAGFRIARSQGQRRRFLRGAGGGARGGRARPDGRRAERNRGRHLPLLRPSLGRCATLSRQGRSAQSAGRPRLPQAFPPPGRRGRAARRGRARPCRERSCRTDRPCGRGGKGGPTSRFGSSVARRLRLLLREREMALKSIRQALNEGLAQEMRRDPRVVVIGEDVAGGAGSRGQRDAYGGVLGVTKGLFGEFGESRVIDTPITESAIMGAAAGAAGGAAAQHSQSLYPIFTSVPGLKCVVPSNAYDAKGLLIQAIRDDDPV